MKNEKHFSKQSRPESQIGFCHIYFTLTENKSSCNTAWITNLLNYQGYVIQKVNGVLKVYGMIIVSF